MKLRIEEITEKGISLELKREINFLAELFQKESGVDFSFVSPAIISLLLRRKGTKVFISGEIHTTLLLKCTRCAEDFIYHMNEIIDFTLIPSALTFNYPPETELTKEDLEFSFYESEEIDIYQIVKEQIFLSLPPYPHCSISCKGLCSGCGSNLNLDSCHCQRSNFTLSLVRK